MPKGHSTLEPRILALEKASAATLHGYMAMDIATAKIVSDITSSLEQRIQALEHRINEMNEAFSRASFPRAPQQSQNGYTQTPISS